MSLPQFEINITAYERADYPNALIEALRIALPSAHITVWDNSPEPLAILGADLVRHHRFNPSLSRVWNWAIAQSRSDWTLVANDDIRLENNWVKALDEDFRGSPPALWHGPSRFFLFNRALLDSIGWFDERLCGFTYEDLDYVRRMNHAKAPHRYGTLSSLNRTAVSLKHEISTRACHPAGNQDFMRTKYHPGSAQEDFHATPLFDTPDFYPRRAR